MRSWDRLQGAPPALEAGVAEFDSWVPDHAGVERYRHQSTTELDGPVRPGTTDKACRPSSTLGGSTDVSTGGEVALHVRENTSSTGTDVFIVESKADQPQAR